jgi:hypothetical protein
MMNLSSCSDTYLGYYIDAKAMSSTAWTARPICKLGSRRDVKHIITVENCILTYDLKITCRGAIKNHQGNIRFECATDQRVTDDSWPDTAEWIKEGGTARFDHVTLRGLSPGSEVVDVEIEAEAVNGWLREDPPGQITIYVSY